MQLQRIHIGVFRNLRDVEIVFDTHLSPSAGNPTDAPPKAIRSHALIGQNGTGKSNLIEALITIFRDIDLGKPASFDYELEYTIRGHQIQLKANLEEQRTPFVWVDGEKKSQDYLTKNDPPGKEPRDERRGPRLLPSHIFAYYSGRNERIEVLFKEHQRRFNRRQEITAEEVLPTHLLQNFRGTESDINAIEKLRKREESKSLRQYGDDRLRRLFYCRGGHSQLVLLACLLSDDPVFQKVLKNLHIESLESALFVLKEPHRLREKRQRQQFDENELNEGDPRFWYARGNVVSEFLDKLWHVAWAPIEQEAAKQIDFRGRTEKQKQIYLYVPSQEKLKELGESVGGTSSFFRYAEGAYIGDLIEEVRITVKKRDEHGGKISFTQLSEGELQILTVLGLMRITSEDHCLFLLDEPDTHLNPIWKLRYFDDIESVLTPRDGALVQGESQILITTHDPMMIGSLRREQVHILRREDNHTLIDTPDEHPQGMGVAGLLKSDLFGLTSTLDQQTLDDLQRRNELIAKQAHEKLTLNEKEELERLRRYLEELGFSREYRDPMYQLFVQKMYQVRSQPMSQLLSPEQLSQQEELAAKIVHELLIKERTDELSELAKALKLSTSN